MIKIQQHWTGRQAGLPGVSKGYPLHSIASARGSALQTPSGMLVVKVTASRFTSGESQTHAIHGYGPTPLVDRLFRPCRARYGSLTCRAAAAAVQQSIPLYKQSLQRRLKVR